MALTALNPALASLDPDALPDRTGQTRATKKPTPLKCASCRCPMDLHASRLDKALAELVPEFSRSYLQQLLGQGAVQLNGQAVQKPAAKVKLGDQLTVAMRPTAQSQAFKPEAMAFNVVFEDEHLLVVNKPAGLVVHPAPGNWSGTLLNGLLAHHAGAVEVPRAGIVHRLDKDTSGLMVVAKTRAVMDALVALIAQPRCEPALPCPGARGWQGAPMQTVDAADRPRPAQPLAHGGGVICSTALAKTARTTSPV